MENKEETNLDQENIANTAKIRFSPEEEQNCYIKSSETDFSLIFLKAGESYTDSYNLMAFYINKGN